MTTRSSLVEFVGKRLPLEAYRYTDLNLGDRVESNVTQASDDNRPEAKHWERLLDHIYRNQRRVKRLLSDVRRSILRNH